MTEPTDLAAALLRGVPRYRLNGYDAGTEPSKEGGIVFLSDILAALTAALAPTDAVRCAECDCDDGNCTWIKMHIESDAPTDAAQAREAALQQPIKRTGK